MLTCGQGCYGALGHSFSIPTPPAAGRRAPATTVARPWGAVDEAVPDCAQFRRVELPRPALQVACG